MIGHEHRPFFGEKALHDITKESSEDGLRRRLSHEIAQAGWDDETRAKLHLALSLALEAHDADTRGEHPYSTHFLRVAIRLVSSDHLGVKDADIVVAALLHDTVEDHPELYQSFEVTADVATPREHAFEAIAELFGERVSRMVHAVTNPEHPDGVSDDEKRAFYQDHVRIVLEDDEEAGVIKLSDFIDNCAGLKYNESPEKAMKMARKYMPLIPDFRLFVVSCTILPQEKVAFIQSQLDRAEDVCTDFLEAAA